MRHFLVLSVVVSMGLIGCGADGKTKNNSSEILKSKTDFEISDGKTELKDLQKCEALYSLKSIPFSIETQPKKVYLPYSKLKIWQDLDLYNDGRPDTLILGSSEPIGTYKSEPLSVDNLTVFHDYGSNIEWVNNNTLSLLGQKIISIAPAGYKSAKIAENEISPHFADLPTAGSETEFELLGSIGIPKTAEIFNSEFDPDESFALHGSSKANSPLRVKRFKDFIVADGFLADFKNYTDDQIAEIFSTRNAEKYNFLNSDGVTYLNVKQYRASSGASLSDSPLPREEYLATFDFILKLHRLQDEKASFTSFEVICAKLN